MSMQVWSLVQIPQVSVDFKAFRPAPPAAHVTHIHHKYQGLHCLSVCLLRKIASTSCCYLLARQWQVVPARCLSDPGPI